MNVGCSRLDTPFNASQWREDIPKNTVNIEVDQTIIIQMYEDIQHLFEALSIAEFTAHSRAT